MKWPLPFVRRKARTQQRPVSLAAWLRECDREMEARLTDRVLDAVLADIGHTPGEMRDLNRLADGIVTDLGPDAVIDAVADMNLRSGDDGSPSMLEGGR